MLPASFYHSSTAYDHVAFLFRVGRTVLYSRHSSPQHLQNASCSKIDWFVPPCKAPNSLILRRLPVPCSQLVSSCLSISIAFTWYRLWDRDLVFEEIVSVNEHDHEVVSDHHILVLLYTLHSCFCVLGYCLGLWLAHN
jgi:hypothetical protein